MFFKLKPTLFILAFILSYSLLGARVVHAAIPVDCPDGYSTTVATADRADGVCSDHQTGTSSSDTTEGVTGTTRTNSTSRQGDCKSNDLTPQNCGILSYFLDAINLLSALVGVVVVLMIAWGGVQYSASRDNPQATAAAKQKVINALLGLVAYLFVYAFLQYIIPGGVL